MIAVRNQRIAEFQLHWNTFEKLFEDCWHSFYSYVNSLSIEIMFSKMALYTSSLYTLSTSPKIRVFFKNIWFMSLSPNQEFIAEFQLHWSAFEKLFEDCWHSFYSYVNSLSIETPLNTKWYSLSKYTFPVYIYYEKRGILQSLKLFTIDICDKYFFVEFKSITPRDQMSTSLCETLDALNPVLYPSVDTILCIMLTMPVTSTTAERSFSVLRRLKTYVRTTMNNDRLSSLALMHILAFFAVQATK
jgi:hypothetical protein